MHYCNIKQTCGDIVELDKTDKNIVNIMIENPRLSLREIGKKAKVSVATAMHRLNKLEKEKIINSYTAKIDYEKIGYDVKVLIEMSISKGRLFDVENKIAIHPNVFAVYDVTGTSDALIFARFPSTRQMDNFLKKIQTYEFVERTETKLILNTIKDESMLVQ